MTDDLTDPHGQLDDDDPLLSAQTFHDDGTVRVRYVPTERAFAVGLTTEDTDGETLLSGGEVDLLLSEPERWDEWRHDLDDDRADVDPATFSDEVREALARASATARFATFADVAGRDTLEAYKRGDMTAAEFMRTFTENVDRALADEWGGSP